MKKIFRYALLVLFYPLIMLTLHYHSKDELVAEFSDLHEEREREIANGNWTAEDEEAYQEFRESIIKDYGAKSIRHLA